MSEKKNQINIARIIYDAYPHSDLLPVDPDKNCLNMGTLKAKVTGENTGDGLFTFIVTEIVEGGESTLEGAVRVTEQAREDIESVLQALYAANSGQSELPLKLTRTRITRSAEELLEACRNITSFTMDLLYKLDNQVNYDDVEEVKQARDTIQKHAQIIANYS